MKILTFATEKGGTGKTTVCYNLACLLAERGKKVLVIDCDQQGNVTTNLCVDIRNQEMYSVADIYDEEPIVPEEICIAAPIMELPTLDLMPSSEFLGGIENLQMNNTVRILYDYIQNNRDFFDYYDAILIDTNPAVTSKLNQSAYYATSANGNENGCICLVCDPDLNSLDGARNIWRIWSEGSEFYGLNNLIKCLIFNNVERTNSTSHAREELRKDEVLKNLVLESEVIHTTRYKECVEKNLPINLLPVKSNEIKSKDRAVECIVAVIDEMEKKGYI